MPPARGKTLQVTGYREFLRACDRGEKETKKYVRGSFREVGDIVRRDAEQLTGHRLRSPRSAAGYRTRVRARGVAVEQSLRRTTGRRPDWGATQMGESLVPALTDNEQRVIAGMAQAIDTVCDHFESGP
jgi:hypothetical protein